MEIVGWTQVSHSRDTFKNFLKDHLSDIPGRMPALSAMRSLKRSIWALEPIDRSLDRFVAVLGNREEPEE